MGQLIDAELDAAWRALDVSREGQGWLTIPVAANLCIPLRAGRLYPGQLEALIFGFAPSAAPNISQLPQAGGFQISPAVSGELPADKIWVALVRTPSGGSDLFRAMSIDLVQSLENAGSASHDLARTFLTRIRTWQEFMERNQTPVLSPQAEIGLAGEIEVLEMLVAHGLSWKYVLDGWLGPSGGLHDFRFRHSAAEVKATLSTNSFVAHVASLDQLSVLNLDLLLLVAVRFQLSTSGSTLSGRIMRILTALGDSVEAEMFSSKVLLAGFIAQWAPAYTRKYERTAVSWLPVDATFPCLTGSSVPASVLRATYDLDLSSMLARDLGVQHAIHLLETS